MTDYCVTDYVQTWKCLNNQDRIHKDQDRMLQVNRSVRSIVAYCAGYSQQDDMLQEENVELATRLHWFKESQQSPTSHLNCETIFWINSAVSKVWLEILLCITHCAKYSCLTSGDLWKAEFKPFSKMWFLTFQHSRANEEKSIAK